MHDFMEVVQTYTAQKADKDVPHWDPLNPFETSPGPSSSALPPRSSRTLKLDAYAVSAGRELSGASERTAAQPSSSISEERDGILLQSEEGAPLRGLRW